MRALLGIFMALWSLSDLAQAQAQLTLDQYLQKVSNLNTGIRAATEQQAAVDVELGQAELVTGSQVFAEAHHVNDKSPVLTPAFNGTERGQQEVKLGLRHQWASGLKSEAYLLEDSQDLSGAIGMPDPSMSLRRRGLRLGLEMPLWKNGLGRDIRLREQALLAKAAGDRALAEFSKIQRLIEAHHLYIRLAQAQESLGIQADLVRQGKKLVDWVQQQVRDRLLEPLHLAQAKVAWEARKLGESQRELEMKTLTQQFNSLLEGKELWTQPKLQRLNQLESILQAPARVYQRKDLAARKHYFEVEKAQISMDREAVKPELALKGQYALYTKRSDRDDTARCEAPTDCSTLAVSLVFAMPLGQSARNQVKQGLSTRLQAKELEIERLKIDAQRDAQVIQEQIVGLSEQARTLRRLITAREERLSFERERQGLGRASTFDLIQAEQELSEAKDQLLAVQAGRLLIIAQLKIYEAKP